MEELMREEAETCHKIERQYMQCACSHHVAFPCIIEAKEYVKIGRGQSGCRPRSIRDVLH